MKLRNGIDIYNLCKELWPITRSITGDGVRETLSIIQQEIPNLTSLLKQYIYIFSFHLY